MMSGSGGLGRVGGCGIGNVGEDGVGGGGMGCVGECGERWDGGSRGGKACQLPRPGVGGWYAMMSGSCGTCGVRVVGWKLRVDAVWVCWWWERGLGQGLSAFLGTFDCALIALIALSEH